MSPDLPSRFEAIYSGWKACDAEVRKPAHHRRKPTGTPLNAIRPTQDICVELQDYSRVTKSGVAFFGTKNSADPPAQAARLADQFIKQNASLFQLLQVAVHCDYDGSDVLLNIASSGAVGAIPLFSPLTARHD